MPPLLLLGLAWLAGLALARLPEPRLGLFWLAVAAPLALLYRRRLPLPWPLALAAVGVAALGLWRGWPAPVEPPPALPPGIAAVRGTVASWPRAGEHETRATLLVDQVETGGAWRPLAASLAARLPLFPAVEVGDRIEVRGAARGLAALDDQRAADWLRRQGLAGEVTGRQVMVLATPAALPGARREPAVAAVMAVLDRALPIPVAGLAAGLLLGERSGLPAELRAAFVATGTSHLLVVSGWNMTLVVAAVGALGARLRLRHHPVGLPLALLTIAGYTWLVGAEPSVVRAAAMGSLAVTALALGRRADPLVALVCAAAVMAGAAPGLLGDLSFQLSFLATLGLLLALPPLAPRLAALPLPARLAAEPLAATVAAQLAVTPLLAHTFGRVSPLAPLINVLVAPWVPLVMAGAAGVALLGLSAAALGQPGILLLSELMAVLTALAAAPLLAAVEAGARLPWASVRLPAPSLPVTLALYGLLALLSLPLLTPAPAATVRQVWQAGRVALPALGLAGLALGAGLIWLALLW